MKTYDCIQGSPEWYELHRGRPTASSFDRIITPKTGKLSASADGFICQLIAETLQGLPMTPADKYISRAIQNGLDMEPEARRWYEMQLGYEVEQIGFCTTDDGLIGCSPDGLVGLDGGLELKCPEGKTHISYLLDGTLPSEYRAQVHGSIIVTGRQWWDFMSYAPGLPPFVLRVVPDQFTEQLRGCLDAFCVRLQQTKDKIAALEAA